MKKNRVILLSGLFPKNTGYPVSITGYSIQSTLRFDRILHLLEHLLNQWLPVAARNFWLRRGATTRPYLDDTDWSGQKGRQPLATCH